MSWIESHQELGQHPKTRKLARLLGASVPTAIGHLHLLWWWAMDYAEQGDLDAFEAEDIADACMWEGDAQLFAGALVQAGFIDGDNRIHDWRDYAGRLIAQRTANRDRKRRSRGQPEDTTGTDGAVTGLPYLTVPNQTEQTDPEDLLSAPADAGRQEPTPIASSKRITEAFRAEMGLEFPDLDEAAEFDKATNHIAYRKAIDKRRYYRNWLTNARKFNEERRNGHGDRTNRGNADGRGPGGDGSTGGSYADLGIPVVR